MFIKFSFHSLKKFPRIFIYFFSVHTNHACRRPSPHGTSLLWACPCLVLYCPSWLPQGNQVPWSRLHWSTLGPAIILTYAWFDLLLDSMPSFFFFKFWFSPSFDRTTFCSITFRDYMINAFCEVWSAWKYLFVKVVCLIRELWAENSFPLRTLEGITQSSLPCFAVLWASLSRAPELSCWCTPVGTRVSFLSHTPSLLGSSGSFYSENTAFRSPEGPWVSLLLSSVSLFLCLLACLWRRDLNLVCWSLISYIFSHFFFPFNPVPKHREGSILRGYWTKGRP